MTGFQVKQKIGFNMENNIQENLITVNKAINSILGGAQEYRIGNRTVKKADLALLISERNKLEMQLSGSGMFAVYFEGR